MRQVGIGAVLVLACAGVAQAQTNDPFWGSWQSSRDIGAARAAGMGGAFVAVADDASATFINPAGMGLIERSEIALGALSRRPGETPTGASLSERSGFGFAGGTTGRGLLGDRWALGGYIIEPHAVNIDLQSPQYLRTIVTDVGGAISWQATSGAYLGARVTVTHAEIEGLGKTIEDGHEVLDVGVASGAQRVTGSFGALFVRDRWRIGATANAGASYELERNAVNPYLAQNLEIGGKYDLRQPSWGSVGASWRAMPQLLLSGQVDWVRYSEIKVAITQGVGRSEDYRLDDAFEPRLGAELSLPAGTVASLQLRGGLYHRAANALTNTSLAATWPGNDGALLSTVGVGLVSQSWRIEGAATMGGERTVLVASAGVQF